MNRTKQVTNKPAEIKERRYHPRQKRYNSICDELDKLIKKYGFKDMQLAFGDVAGPHVSSYYWTDRGMIYTQEGISPLWGEDPDEIMAKTGNWRDGLHKRPPGDDHAALLRDKKTGKPACYLSQPYNLDLHTLKEIVRLCEEKGLNVTITGDSTHFPSKTCSIIYTRPPQETRRHHNGFNK